MDIIILIIGLVGLVYSIIIHEISHGWVADKLGDPTARLSGRITLNPIPHIDPIGTILLPLLSFLSPFNFIFGWAKPVPIDPYNLQNSKKDTLLISIAGPVSNLVIAFILSIVLRIYPTSLLFSILIPLIRINIVLAVFNLIPIHPLDGGKILVGLLPDKESRQVEYFLEKFGYMLLILLIISPVFSVIVSPVVNFITYLLIPSFGTI